MLFALLLATPALGESRQAASLSVNPIRKVVTMLQMMQKKVANEVDIDKEMHEKFMCHCKSAGATLEKSISDCETGMPEMESKIEELEALLAQLKADVAQHQKDRQAAKDAIATATKTREEEHKTWVAGKAQHDAEVAMIKKVMAAILALEK